MSKVNPEINIKSISRKTFPMKVKYKNHALEIRNRASQETVMRLVQSITRDSDEASQSIAAKIFHLGKELQQGGSPTMSLACFHDHILLQSL